VAAARSRAFRERARLEADRYGPDPWIFVRELLQNSRDAGARRVVFDVSEQDERSHVRCRDDGEGMSFEHARRYLFSLYASSKEDSKNQAGKFGVGFWSILRFDPAWITIRSCTRSGEAWGLRLDGSLEHATRVAPLDSPGTEITLERSGSGDGRLEHRIYDAVWQSARYLYRRDNTEAALPVTVNGRPANADFALPAPSAAFRRGNVRGVVGLGPAPRVELFSRGLRVRSAASLEDLVAPAGRHTARMRVQFPELPGGLAPQALLESDKLEVMLSRSDARDNRALSKLVRLAQKELEHLIDRQLSQARPLSIWRRMFEFVSGRLRESLALRTALGAALGALLAVGIAWGIWGDRILAPIEQPDSGHESVVVAGAPRRPGPRAYRDLASRYRGPRVDVLAPGTEEPIPLRYEPPDERLYFAALTFAHLAQDGSPAPLEDESMFEYAGAPSCGDPCISVQFPVVADAELVHIPVPTGHRIVEGSLVLNGVQMKQLTATRGGHAALRFVAPFDGKMEYQTTPGTDPSPPPKLETSPSLPDDLVGFASGLRRQPVSLRVEALVDRVRERVDYDRTNTMAARHVAAQNAGMGFIERTLELGAGDCDIQNSLLVALLHAADVEARLAVGFIGVRGRPYPWLHAWVEYRDEHRNWHVADASETADTGLPTPPPIVASASPTGPPTAASAGPTQALAGPIAGPDTDGGAQLPAEPGTLEAIDAFEGSTGPALESEELATPSGDDPSNAFFAWVRQTDRQWPWLIRSLPFVLLGLAGLSLAGGRTRRAMKLDAGADLSRLLQGVLQQPGAFGNVQALFTRPLVPLIDGDAISLNRARELAGVGRFYRTEQQPALARKAVKAGASVVDVRLPEGKTVADALGAVDLDRWATWLENSWADALTDSVNAALRARSENLGLRIGRGLPGEVSVLDLGPLGTRLPGLKARRLILVDEKVPWLAQARTLYPSAPAVATFIALDHVADRLDLPSDRRARLLSEQARLAIFERAS
jgi:transglutaminase-like putative cysteine protease